MNLSESRLKVVSNKSLYESHRTYTFWRCRFHLLGDMDEIESCKESERRRQTQSINYCAVEAPVPFITPGLFQQPTANETNSTVPG